VGHEEREIRHAVTEMLLERGSGPEAAADDTDYETEPGFSA
jgi:hypothetical protein